MGVDAEDVDGDGRPELFVTNFRGQYTTLYQNLGGAELPGRQRLGRDRQRQRSPTSAGAVPWPTSTTTACPTCSWSTARSTTTCTSSARTSPSNSPRSSGATRAGTRFRRVRDPGPFFDDRHVARGAAFGDLDDDGRLDVVVGIFDGRPAVLRNESEPRSWVRVELLGRASNRSAIGATVILSTGDRVIHRLIKGGGSYLSSNDPRALFGLGGADHVDRIEVRWPGGARSVLKNPALGQTHLIREPAGPRERTPLMTARALLTAALASTALAVGGLGAWACLRPRPTLEPALRLIDSGRADDAERDSGLRQSLPGRPPGTGLAGEDRGRTTRSTRSPRAGHRRGGVGERPPRPD